ncbi:AbrB/MazE/SpoVT family DNA-binding domain-containing protein [Candidatus Woesearchaeota archaeon]|nr:AbrB/MazE/SpoVT family DNA-binding domain-containing protein [Candidatus Woesearchaeota archaeon]
MKCVFCSSATEEKVVEYAEMGVNLGRFKAKVCTKCGETFFDSETAGKIQAKSKELGLFGLAKKTKVAEVGNSMAIRVPKRLAEFIGLKKGQEVLITPEEKNKLSIEV